MEIVFDGAGLPPHERLSAWLETTTQALMTTKVTFLEPTRPIDARLTAMQLGDAQLTAMSYPPLVVRRTKAMIRQSDPEQYQLGLTRTGRTGIDQARTSNLLTPGNFFLYDTSKPFTTTIHGGQAGGEALFLLIPKQLLPLPERLVARLLAVPLDGTAGIGRVLAQFMVTVADEYARCVPLDTTRLGNTIVDLVSAVLAHHLSDDLAGPAQSPPSVLFLRVTAFVDQHLRTPELGPSMIASAHHISLRYLHRVFQRNGTTVGAYIKARRLDRCRRDLADPALNHLTIHTIGARWGFPNPAEFSRTFRATLGIPPSEYRAMTTGT